MGGALLTGNPAGGGGGWGKNEFDAILGGNPGNAVDIVVRSGMGGGFGGNGGNIWRSIVWQPQLSTERKKGVKIADLSPRPGQEEGRQASECRRHFELLQYQVEDLVAREYRRRLCRGLVEF